jgi:hypothetical protein
MRWGVYYDAENPGAYLENLLVDSWAEHTRQHDRFTVADRKFEERVLSLVLESPKTRHFLYANRVKRVSLVHENETMNSWSANCRAMGKGPESWCTVGAQLADPKPKNEKV